MNQLGYEPTWADVLEEHAAQHITGLRLVAQLRACEISALAFCRLLERWARGDAHPATPGERQSALRRAADRVETALTGLEDPLRRYLLELEAEVAESRSWYGGPGAAELVDWEPVLTRAGVRVPAERVAQAYLELAVLVRALEGLTAAARMAASTDRSSLWAGLFDLRENLLGRALDDLRTLAAS
jgi:hypothetical protein